MSKVYTELQALRVSREVMRIKGDGGLIVGRKYGVFDGCFEGVEIGRMSKIGEGILWFRRTMRNCRVKISLSYN